MGQTVYHVELGVYLDLGSPDLGHPELPGLWERLRGQRWARGDLQCPHCAEEAPNRPEWMYLREEPGGRPVAVHFTAGLTHPRAPAGDSHKALVSRIVSVAERSGFGVDLDERVARGRRRADVVVRGDGGFQLACQAQVAYATATSVRARTATAERDGMRPLWTTTSRTATLIDGVPWARIDRLPWQRIADNTEALPVRGGVRALRMERCEDQPMVCRDRGYGRCGGWHDEWDPRQLRFDDLIERAAAQCYVPVRVKRPRTGDRWYWAPVAHRNQYDYYLAHRDDNNFDPTARTEPRPPVRPGVCGAGPGPCTAPGARLYPCGWRCDRHRP